MNIVVVASAENAALDREQQQKEFVAMQGIDFLYDESCHRSKIKICHSRVLAQDEVVNGKLNLHRNFNLPANHMDNDAAVNHEGRYWRSQITPSERIATRLHRLITLD